MLRALRLWVYLSNWSTIWPIESLLGLSIPGWNGRWRAYSWPKKPNQRAECVEIFERLCLVSIFWRPCLKLGLSPHSIGWLFLSCFVSQLNCINTCLDVALSNRFAWQCLSVRRKRELLSFCPSTITATATGSGSKTRHRMPCRALHLHDEGESPCTRLAGLGFTLAGRSGIHSYQLYRAWSQSKGTLPPESSPYLCVLDSFAFVICRLHC